MALYKTKTSNKTGFTLVCYSFKGYYIFLFWKSQTKIFLHFFSFIHYNRHELKNKLADIPSDLVLSGLELLLWKNKFKFPSDTVVLPLDAFTVYDFILAIHPIITPYYFFLLKLELLYVDRCSIALCAAFSFFSSALIC